MTAFVRSPEKLDSTAPGYEKPAGVASFYVVGGMGALWAPGSGKSVLIQDWDDTEAMAKHGHG